jgi:hypothetical protein
LLLLLSPASSATDSVAEGRPHLCGHAEWPEALAPLELRTALCDAPAVAGQPGCFGGAADGDAVVCVPTFLGLGFSRTATAKLFELLTTHAEVCLAPRGSALLLRVPTWPNALLGAWNGSHVNGSAAAPPRRCAVRGDITPWYADAGGGPPDTFPPPSPTLLPHPAPLCRSDAAAQTQAAQREAAAARTACTAAERRADEVRAIAERAAAATCAAAETGGAMAPTPRRAL